MTDPVEVMADQIARAVGYTNGLMSLPREGRDKFRARAQAALSELDAAGFAVVPKGLVEATRGLLRSEYESEEPGLCDCIDNDGQPYQSDYLAKQIETAEAMLSAAQVKP